MLNDLIDFCIDKSSALILKFKSEKFLNLIYRHPNRPVLSRICLNLVISKYLVKISFLDTSLSESNFSGSNE